MKRWTVITLFLALAALPALSGSATPKEPANLPKNLKAGFKAWAGECSQCHQPERAYSPKYVTEKQIAGLVARMARKPGASISRTDQSAITAYLVWHARDAAQKDNS